MYSAYAARTDNPLPVLHWCTALIDCESRRSKGRGVPQSQKAARRPMQQQPQTPEMTDAMVGPDDAEKSALNEHNIERFGDAVATEGKETVPPLSSVDVDECLRLLNLRGEAELVSEPSAPPGCMPIKSLALFAQQSPVSAHPNGFGVSKEYICFGMAITVHTS